MRKKYYYNGIHRYTEPPPSTRRKASCLRKAPKHILPTELICDPTLAAEACEEAKRAALLAASALTTAIAASGLADDTRVGNEDLVDAPTLARRLNVKTSWVRTEERAGRIPSVHVGRYVKFRPSEALAALAARKAG